MSAKLYRETCKGELHLIEVVWRQWVLHSYVGSTGVYGGFAAAIAIFTGHIRDFPSAIVAFCALVLGVWSIVLMFWPIRRAGRISLLSAPLPPQSAADRIKALNIDWKKTS